MIDRLEREISPYKQQLIEHPLYRSIETVDDPKLFTTYHNYAVWDFMSLVKKLQQELTCTQLPWQPAPHPEVGRLINEIVWGEETDVNFEGRPMSHFEMYREAMEQMGVHMAPFDANYQRLIQTEDILAELNTLPLPTAVTEFLKFTFQTIAENKIHCIAAVFTFGREDLIPDMFIEMIKNMGQKDNANTAPMVYYFERHIEVDGDGHGPMALNMIQVLCGNDPKKWEEATTAATTALQKRIALWDAITTALSEKKSVTL